MDVPVIIPQVFYDLIARILPGFVFLLMVKIIILDSISGFNNLVILQYTTSIDVLFYIITYLVLCYFIGWILKIYTIYGLKYELNKFPKVVMNWFQEIRLRNEAAGFRILKLRAEARMWEVIRNGMFLLLISYSVIFILGQLLIVDFTTQSVFISGFKFFTIVFLFITSQIAMKGAVKNYVVNILDIYNILCKYNRTID